MFENLVFSGAVAFKLMLKQKILNQKRLFSLKASVLFDTETTGIFSRRFMK